MDQVGFVEVGTEDWVAQALAPVVFGLALQQWGAQAMWLSAALGLLAFLALMAIRPRRERAAPP